MKTIGEILRESTKDLYLTECKFEGSQLKSTLANTNNIDLWIKEVESVKKDQPNSIFWEEALQFIKSRKKNHENKRN